MSNVSAGSSGSASGMSRGGVIGIPSICWCGQPIVQLVSKTKYNPYRRFYRCAYAADQKLEDNSHVFKWIDEALINEIKFVDVKVKKVEEDVKEIKKLMNEMIEFEKKLFEKMEMDVEERLIERIEGAVSDAKSGLWKRMILIVVLEFIIILACIKLLG